MISNDELKYDSVLGTGSFGQVWLGEWRGKTGCNQEDFKLVEE